MSELKYAIPHCLYLIFSSNLDVKNYYYLFIFILLSLYMGVKNFLVDSPWHTKTHWPYVSDTSFVPNC